MIKSKFITLISICVCFSVSGCSKTNKTDNLNNVPSPTPIIEENIYNDFLKVAQDTILAEDNTIGVKDAEIHIDTQGELISGKLTVWALKQHFENHEPPEDYWREVEIGIDANKNVNSQDNWFGDNQGDGLVHLIHEYDPLNNKSMLSLEKFIDIMEVLDSEELLKEYKGTSSNGYRIIYQLDEYVDYLTAAELNAVYIQVKNETVTRVEKPDDLALDNLYPHGKVPFLLVDDSESPDIQNMIVIMVES